MAKRTTRRRRSTRPAVRRNRRRSSGTARGGFISSPLLLTSAGVAGGFLGCQFLVPKIPGLNSLGTYGPTVGKAIVGIGGGYLLKRFGQRNLALAFAAGALASAALDIVQPMLSRSNLALGPAAPNVAGYQLEDGSVVAGYELPGGQVMDMAGNYVGEVDEIAV